jgi:hypothetical protein
MTEDIKIKISADDVQATEAFKKIAKNAKAAEEAMKAIDQEAKVVKGSFEELSKYGNFDDVTQEAKALKNEIKGLENLNLQASVSLIKETAKVSFEVGQQIGNWVWGVDDFNAELDKTNQSIMKMYDEIEARARSRGQGMGLEQIKQEIDGYEQSIARLTKQQNELNEENFRFELSADKESVATAIKNQERLRDALKEVYEQRSKEPPPAPRGENEQVMAQFVNMTREEAQAFREAQHEAELYIAEQEKLNRLKETQSNYLANLDAELVRIKEGEEAYLRLTLAKQGFNDESIEAAVRLKAEINELNELEKIRLKEAETVETKESIRVSRPGELQSEQQRFITRGPGMKGEEKILAATQKQVEMQQALLAEQKKQRQLLEQRLPRETV